MTRQTIRALAYLIPAFMLSTNTLADSLHEAVLSALETGPDMQIKVQEGYAAQEALKSAYAAYLPTLDWRAETGFEHANNPDVSATGSNGRVMRYRENEFVARQMIWDGYRAKSDVEKHLWQTKAAAHDVANTAQVVSVAVVNSYMNVMMTQELLELAEEYVSHYNHLNNQMTHAAYGHVSDTARTAQLQSRLARAQTRQLDVNAQHQTAQYRYKRLIGQPPITKQMRLDPFPEFAMPATEGAAIGVALTYHPALRAAIAQVGAAKAETRRKNSVFYPEVDLNMRASSKDNIEGISGSQVYASAGISVRYNLFNGGKDLAQSRKSAHEAEAVTQRRNDTRRLVEEQVKNTWLQMATASNQFRLFEQQSHAAQKTKDAYLHEFRGGTRPLLDVLDGLDEWYEANTSLIQSKYEMQYQKYRLLSDTGRLLDTLEIPQPPGSEFKL